jgi:hypothetical protein
MDKTDLGLLLGGFSALALLIGTIAALVVMAFVAGYLLGRAARSSKPNPKRRR